MLALDLTKKLLCSCAQKVMRRAVTRQRIWSKIGGIALLSVLSICSYPSQLRVSLLYNTRGTNSISRNLPSQGKYSERAGNTKEPESNSGQL